MLDEIWCTHITACGHSYARLETCSRHLVCTAGDQTAEGPSVQQPQQAGSVRVPPETFNSMLEVLKSRLKAQEIMAGGADDASGRQVQP